MMLSNRCSIIFLELRAEVWTAYLFSVTKIAIVIFNHLLDTLSSKRGQPSGNVQRIILIGGQIVLIYCKLLLWVRKTFL